MNKDLDTSITVLRVVGEALFLYGLLGWIYGVLVDITHPDWLPLALSHLTTWIRTDTFAVLSFILSIIGFFVWRLAQKITRQR
ncbi:MAG: hypothetical protein ABSD73_10525 [Candidatus Bathyarchaeia archaeon]|jgi:hypothetical protein